MIALALVVWATVLLPMTLMRWTIVLRGRYSGLESPITFLRFWTRWGAQRWLDRWQDGRIYPAWISDDRAREIRDDLLDAYVARIDD